MSFKITPEDKKTYIAILLLALFWCGVYAWWKVEHPTIWHYKITVTVDTPEGVKTGSAVREAKVHIPFLEIQGLYDRRIDIKGEAVVIDLGQRGILFAPMDTDDYIPVFRSFPDAPDAFTKDGLKYYQTLVKNKAKAEIPKGNYPRLVMFKDINDPKSIELAYQAEMIFSQTKNAYELSTTDNLEKLFGIGVKLKDITIEMTDEGVTTEIDTLIPWLPYFYNKRLDNERYGTITAKNSLANSLSSGAFLTARK